MIDGSHVVLVQDHDEESFIAVFDKLTGRELWRKECPEFLRDYATPVIWTVEGRRQVVVLAIAPGGRGDITTTHVRWEHLKQIPYCPSPLYYRRALLMVKNGGIMTVLSADTRDELYTASLEADGHATPAIAEAKVFVRAGETLYCFGATAAGDWQEFSLQG